MTYEESVKARSDKIERTKINECYQCAHKRNVPGDAHIQCMEPDDKMTGNPHGVKRGWFMYPLVFDPTWKNKLCDNFKRHAWGSEMIKGKWYVVDNDRDDRVLRGPYEHEETAVAVRKEMETQNPDVMWNLWVIRGY